MEQAELEDLLVGGEEVALHVVGDEGKGIGRRPLLLAREALGDPVGQAFALGGVEFDGDAGLDERGEPADLARRPVDLGQGDEGDDAVVEVAGVALQRLAAVAAGLAVGDAQVDQLAGAEQRQVAGGGLQFAPAETLAGDQHLALGIALLAGGGADGVAGFEHQQGLVAVEDVERGERLVELGGELLGAQVHGLGAAAGILAAASRRSSCCTRSFCMSR